MKDNELLVAISGMMDSKLAPVYHQMDGLQEGMGRLENRMGRLEDCMGHLEGRMDHLEESMDHLEDRMDHLEDRMDHLEARIDNVEKEHGARLTRIELLLENDVIPRLNTIESCYTSTFDRYKTYTERADGAYKDIPLMKKTIIDHSGRIQELEKKIS